MTDVYSTDYSETDSAGRSFTVTGGDWDTITDAAQQEEEGHLVVNMGPQHPSTHGVLRVILALDGETVTECRLAVGYLHTGIEKNTEYRTWTQGVTFVTRADYLMPIYNEVAYCLSVERLLGIEQDVPERANIIRVLLMELQRFASHMVAICTGGMEIGATAVMTFGFREREIALDILELITGLRLNHAYVRPGGVVQDLPDNAVEKTREAVKLLRKNIGDYEKLLNENPLFKGRTKGVAKLDLPGCLALGVTGPVLRSAGMAWDLRKSQPYCGYDTYDFEVITGSGADAYDRYLIRIEEMKESLAIMDQCLDRLGPPGEKPVMVDDPKIAWPARLAVGSDGQGNSYDHIRHIMGESMEALIHHFKLVTEGFRVPAGQAYVPIESPKGELGVHVVSDGGTRPYRVHMRDPSFTNLQAVPAMTEGGMVADVIVAIASVDPVLGGVDR